jgi:glycosyltransferase involved in cell wall biosynthesis
VTVERTGAPCADGAIGTLRVLVVCRELPPIGGGAGNVAWHLAMNAAARGHRVDAVTMGHGDLPPDETIDGVRILRVDARRRDADSSTIPEMVRFVARARSRVRQLVGKHGYDVVHAHAIIPDGLLLGAARRTRAVVTAHGSDVPGYNPDAFGLAHVVARPLWRRAVARPDVLTTPSGHLRDLIRAAGARRTVHVVPNGVDTRMFGMRPKSRAILVVARLVPRKNTALVLRAAAGIETPLTIHIVGDGPERRALEQLAGTLPRHDVHFHGWLGYGSSEWRRLYEESRFFVFPSSSESFGMTGVEAQLARMVVIAADIPGIREALGDEARYLPALDVGSMRAAIEEAVAQPDDLLDREGDAGRTRVLDRFSWERVTDRFLALYVP